MNIPDKEREFILQYLIPSLGGAKFVIDFAIKSRDKDLAMAALADTERELARIRDVLVNGLQTKEKPPNRGS